MVQSVSADSLVDLIDSGGLRVRAHAVTRSLLAVAPNATPEERAVLSGLAEDDQERMTTRLWRLIEARPLDQQGGLRLLIVLLRPDIAIDGYLAEYLLDWSRQRGLNEDQTVQAFMGNGTTSDAR